MASKFSLDNRTVLVTGASSGIGASVAAECCEMGARVVITARNRERLDVVLGKISGTGNSSIVADLSTEEGIDTIVSESPVLDGLVLNAGIVITSPLQFIKRETIQSVFDVNTFAPMLLLQKLLKAKKMANGASAVFTSSMAGMGSVTMGNAIYSASKGAINAFVRSAALELASKNIRVNSVCPGMVDTNLLKENPLISKNQLDKDIKNYPLRRYGTPNDIAYAIIYLLSDASSWVTGDNMLIDGGFSLN